VNAPPLAAGLVVLLLGLGSAGHAAEFTCAGGNVVCLIAAVRSANSLGEPSMIQLAEGTYTLTEVDNATDGPNGLPSTRCWRESPRRTKSLRGSTISPRRSSRISSSTAWTPRPAGST